jgi:hypothetical protein
MRAHTTEEAAFVVDTVAEWQDHLQEDARAAAGLRRRRVLPAGRRPFPAARAYDEFPQHENGIGMARAFVDGFTNPTKGPGGVRHGFFASVDARPAEGYRAIRCRRPTEPSAPRTGCRPPGRSPC